ncbi:MAG: hypothetical protein JSR79_08100 [Proteobacteria bacterium]|nr:hypothetical protein [Pseudomonadota bacterium]
MRRQLLDAPHFKQYLTELHDIMVRLVGQLRDAGIELPPKRAGHSYNADATIAAALDLTLAAYEYGAPLFSSWLEMRVMSAVISGNARPLTTASAQPPLCAGQIIGPPGELRRPVSSRAVARVLNISEATARRQLRIALDRGLVERRGDGVILTKKAIETPALIRLPARASMRALRTVERLGAAGFRFEDPASHYIAGEPPLLDFE